MSQIKKATLFIIGILLIDQISKFYIKLNFSLYEAIPVFDWFQICFVENNGMAFGIELFSKIFLSLFRIVAVGFLGYYLHTISKKGYRTGYMLAIAGVLAGALGNLIDGTFYGLIFSESFPGQVATLFPEGGGYAPMFYGKVVDMLYFPLIHDKAGDVLFFRPVFNIADSAISISAAVIILFYRKEFNDSFAKKEIEEQQKA